MNRHEDFIFQKLLDQSLFSYAVDIWIRAGCEGHAQCLLYIYVRVSLKGDRLWIIQTIKRRPDLFDSNCIQVHERIEMLIPIRIITRMYANRNWLRFHIIRFFITALECLEIEIVFDYVLGCIRYLTGLFVYETES